MIYLQKILILITQEIIAQLSVPYKLMTLWLFGGAILLLAVSWTWDGYSKEMDRLNSEHKDADTDYMSYRKERE